MRCILPVETAGQFDSVDGESVSRTGKEVSTMNVPLARHQLRSAEMLDAVRIHRQGGLTVALRLWPNVKLLMSRTKSQLRSKLIS